MDSTYITERGYNGTANQPARQYVCPSPYILLTEGLGSARSHLISGPTTTTVAGLTTVARPLLEPGMRSGVRIAAIST